MEGDWAWAVLVAASGLGAVAGSAWLHFVGLAKLDRWCFLGREGAASAGAALTAVLGVMVLHLLQMLAFGVLFWWVTQWPAGGVIDAGGDASLLEAVYLSALNYSTLGLGGDLSPAGPIRMLVAIESLFGLLAISWSAVFTYHRLSRRLPGQAPGGSGH
ncbi:MAG TPA: ion channel [Xanthomonadaceae bacterium]|nr:ion channel [Xanthomonadaceae bacterium]